MNNKEQYEQNFLQKNGVSTEALKVALDVRKFEIELYWKRTTYFLSFITVMAGAYAAVFSSDFPKKEITLLVVASIGLVFSLSWFLANRGSKKWQENWENHVDLLENNVHGPLFKTILSRPKADDAVTQLANLIIGPSSYSVSKINQLLSFYVTIIWFILFIFHMFPFNCEKTCTVNFSVAKCIIFSVTVITIFFAFTITKTYKQDVVVKYEDRKTFIKSN